MMACVMAAGRIDLLEEMTPTSRLRGVALVERLHELAREAPPAELESVLRALPAAQWAKLEGASRSWRLAAGGRVDPVAGEGAAAVASMVRDGFARQRALTELIRRPDPDPRVTTRAVALRALDHVETIRADAVTYLEAMSGVEHLEAALAVLLAAAQRRAAPAAIGYVEHAILTAGESHLWVLRGSDDRAVRRWAWQSTSRAAPALAADLERTAAADPDLALRRWAAQHLVSEYPNIDAVRCSGPALSSCGCRLCRD